MINFNLIEAGYPKGINCAIVMFDLTNKSSFANVKFYINVLTTICPQMPIVLCGNKVDVTAKERKVKPKEIQAFIAINGIYYDISSKNNYNYEKPFLYLMKKMTQKDNLVFVQSPALIPPTITISKNS